MSEPKLAIDAILDNPEQHTFKPLSVARYALLDLVDSPFVGKQPFNLASVIPSFFIMTAESSDLRKYNSRNVDKLTGDALEFADGISDPKILSNFTKEFLDYMAELNKIAPDSTDDPKVKKKETDPPTDS